MYVLISNLQGAPWRSHFFLSYKLFLAYTTIRRVLMTHNSLTFLNHAIFVSFFSITNFISLSMRVSIQRKSLLLLPA